MNVQIAQRLAELRRAKGYSQEALANELGLSRQAVSKWERAESSPDTENLIALARLYGVSLDDLLNVDKDIEDDVAFENAERAEKTARAQAEREEALREQRAHQAVSYTHLDVYKRQVAGPPVDPTVP
ncbi:helix-turn-helix transcriptional regulator [Collinsella ihumii]|uniref:helix-turn-helix transcriptional regulator n=1 Tax=Collinsella ihumii TaxID=1720204 RepID=UPI0008311AB4|nr:helix-turn-helix transcriptional regulator [Collinsella ihumii]